MLNSQINSDKNFHKYSVLIVFISFVFYMSVGLCFGLSAKLVYHPNYICDLYFGFDNALHEASFVRHPLLKLISKSLNLLLIGSSVKTSSVVLVTICSSLLSLQNLFIFKILNKIVGLTTTSSLWLSLFFMTFAGNLLLSFTFDSYVFTSCVLPIFFYYFFKGEKENKELSTPLFILSTVIVAGITVSNFFKILLVSFLSKFKKDYLSKLFLIGCSFLGIFIVFYDKIQASLSFMKSHLYGPSFDFSYYFQFFLGSVFVIPRVVTTRILYIDGSSIDAVIGGSYSAIFPNVLFYSLFLFLVFIVLKNRSNIWMRFLIVSFLVDIVIHVVFGLGIHEAYIFTGNYAFIFPIIFGIGFKNISSLKFRKLYVGILMFFLVGFAILNSRSLYELYHFALYFYKN